MPTVIIKLVRQTKLQIIFTKKRMIFRMTRIKKFGFELVNCFDFFLFRKFLCDDFLDGFLKRFSATKDLRFLFSLLRPAILLSFLPFYRYSRELFSENRIF